MHNRGNGKGGGIAAVGCFPGYEEFYAIHVGYMEPGLRKEIEREYITPYFEVEKAQPQPSLGDHRELPGLEVKPPEVWRYFCRVKQSVLEKYARENGYTNLQKAEDQFVYKNSFTLSKNLYASIPDKKAFVLSHGKNMMVLKGVGYAEDLLKYYMLEDMEAHVWIGHQRYPTRGRVWHPGGAHPFVGLNEALVHNGDFANYHSICEYLYQKDIFPLYLTDTEVAALLFDYYARVLQYPLEYIIEAIAPTTERDFQMLPKVKQRMYRAIRAAHIHGSPDGPWFFIIARSLAHERSFQLVSITDTSMLRPHVFAVLRGERSLGVVASEQQAIDALLSSLAREDESVCPVADMYWISRGGSHTDGGAFIFSVIPDNKGKYKLICCDKFGREVIPAGTTDDLRPLSLKFRRKAVEIPHMEEFNGHEGGSAIFSRAVEKIRDCEYEDFSILCGGLVEMSGESDECKGNVIEALTLLRDRRYDPGRKKLCWLLSIIDNSLKEVLSSSPPMGTRGDGKYVLINYTLKGKLDTPSRPDQVLIVDSMDFKSEGVDSVSELMVRAYKLGWRNFIIYNTRGDRFIGCGLGPDTTGVRIDVYGNPGDYLGSGIDGAELYVHANAQDQVGQILNSGKIVIFGNVGQTFLYGAKGGSVYVMGNTAGRPLINSVGRIRAVINGTCLDYAAESFMAGDELDGGFIIINGLRVNPYGEFIGLEEKFPGCNFFSLASGGAGYLNDPYHTVTEDQLNGAEFTEFTQQDWNVIEPYLKENQKLFGIMIDRDILTVDRTRKWPGEVYRKVVAARITMAPR